MSTHYQHVLPLCQCGLNVPDVKPPVSYCWNNTSGGQRKCGTFAPSDIYLARPPSVNSHYFTFTSKTITLYNCYWTHTQLFNRSSRGEGGGVWSAVVMKIWSTANYVYRNSIYADRRCWCNQLFFISVKWEWTFILINLSMPVVRQFLNYIIKGKFVWIKLLFNYSHVL